MLVVSANLQEGRKNPTHPDQIRRFARRLRRLLPFAPDVLLLQEVTEESASVAATMLGDVTEFNYGVQRGPVGLGVVTPDETQEVIADTAIIVNDDSTRVRDPGGFIATSYDPSDGIPGMPRRTKEHAYLLASKRGENSRIALVSIHFVVSKFLEPFSVGFCYKRDWTHQIVDQIEASYPRTDHLHVIAGDFNNRRCMEFPETVNCEPWPYWHAFVNKLKYKDAVLTIHGTSDADIQAQYQQGPRSVRSRIDFIFTTARVIDASHDSEYVAGPDDPGFYSDHPLLWSLISTRRSRTSEET
jgi:endonuclease/exonuclease/phosphatase family metal-dependent hydrolase